MIPRPVTGGRAEAWLSGDQVRYNARRIGDGERAALAVGGVEGKRLMLKEPTGG
jgi:hypothetical protein